MYCVAPPKDAILAYCNANLATLVDLRSDDPVHHIPHRQKGKKNAFL
jgi:hypothetical protein